MRATLIFIIVIVFSSNYAWCNDDLYEFDRVIYSARAEKFYDSLESRSTNSRLSKFIYKSIFIPTSTKIKNVYNERIDFDEHSGKTINNIYIHRDNVVDSLVSHWAARMVNRLHYMTRETEIKQDLFFTQGSEVNSELLVYNEQYIQSRPYIYRAKIKLTQSEDNPESVDMWVNTKDSWTIGGDASINYNKNSFVELYDKNFLGTGNKLSISTNFNLKEGSYGGNEALLSMPNIFGSFFTAEIWGGKNFDNNHYGLSTSKSFIQKDDYMLNFEAYKKKENYYVLHKNTKIQIEHQNANLGIGKSIYLPGLNNSIYFGVNIEHRYYTQRDSVSYNLNPVFHNNTKILGALGIYREYFDATNLIYGFGQREYISRGYKLELISGYRLSEFYDDIYMGINFKKGVVLPIGNLAARIEVGTYYQESEQIWRQSALNTELRYFSNIIKAGECRVRQFVNINYVRGWNRDYGCNEYVSLDQDDLRGLDIYDLGQHRLLINTETVVFTPFSPLGFRIAMFGFADFGIIGNKVNLNKNNKYTTFGFGIRVKNDKLVFSRLEFRLGFSLSTQNGWINNDMFKLSNDYTLEQYRYLPTSISTVEYQ